MYKVLVITWEMLIKFLKNHVLLSTGGRSANTFPSDPLGQVFFLYLKSESHAKLYCLVSVLGFFQWDNCLIVNAIFIYCVYVSSQGIYFNPRSFFNLCIKKIFTITFWIASLFFGWEKERWIEMRTFLFRGWFTSSIYRLFIKPFFNTVVIIRESEKS